MHIGNTIDYTYYTMSMVICNIPRLQGIKIHFLLSYSSRIYLDGTYNKLR